MAGHTDEADEPFVARRDQGGDDTVGREGGVPLVGLDEVVQLDEVDLIDPHPIERPLEFGPRCAPLSLTRLGGEEEPVAIRREERCQSKLRLAVRRRGVDVVDAGRIDELERGIGTRLAHRPECRGTEDDAGRLVTRPAER